MCRWLANITIGKYYSRNRCQNLSVIPWMREDFKESNKQHCKNSCQLWKNLRWFNLLYTSQQTVSMLVNTPGTNPRNLKISQILNVHVETAAKHRDLIKIFQSENKISDFLKLTRSRGTFKTSFP